MDDINLGLHPWPQLCPLSLMANYGLLWHPCFQYGASLDSYLQAACHLPPNPPSPPTYPPP